MPPVYGTSEARSIAFLRCNLFVSAIARFILVIAVDAIVAVIAVKLIRLPGLENGGDPVIGKYDPARSISSGVGAPSCDTERDAAREKGHLWEAIQIVVVVWPYAPSVNRIVDDFRRLG